MPVPSNTEFREGTSSLLSQTSAVLVDAYAKTLEQTERDPFVSELRAVFEGLDARFSEMQLECSSLQGRVSQEEARVGELGMPSDAQGELILELMAGADARLLQAKESTDQAIARAMREMERHLFKLREEIKNLREQLILMRSASSTLETTHNAQIVLLQQQEETAQAECTALRQTLENTRLEMAARTEAVGAARQQAVLAATATATAQRTALLAKLQSLEAAEQSLQTQYQQDLPATYAEEQEIKAEIEKLPSLVSLVQERDRLISKEFQDGGMEIYKMESAMENTGRLRLDVKNLRLTNDPGYCPSFGIYGSAVAPISRELARAINGK